MFQLLLERQESIEEKIVQLQGDVTYVKGDVAELRKETNEGFKKTHERLDNQGKALAYLEDDAPTREEFTELNSQVSKIKKSLVH